MKSLVLLLIFPFLLFKLSAQEISYEDAKQTASSFFVAVDNTSNELKSATIAMVDTFVTYYIPKDNQLKSARQSKEPAFYIFNRSDKLGFVIVSGDKSVKEIIAYSTNSNFSDPNPGLKALLNQYVQEITYAKENNLPEITGSYDFSQVTTGNGLLGNIEWGQSPNPFNSKCPEDINSKNDNKRVSAGCVATAMAQIIFYYKYPRIGNGYHEYMSRYKKEVADFANTEFKYELMVDKPMLETRPNIESTNEQISTLLYYCGVAVDMNYNYTGSGSSIGDAIQGLESYFKYNTIQRKWLITTGWEDWEQLIRFEIENKRPVLYEGNDPNNIFINDPSVKHAFIIDGYETTFGTYHINWGWSGECNTYYSIRLLNPLPNGVQYEFSTLQNMLIGIEPVNPDIYPPQVAYTSNSTELNTDITISFGEPILSKTITYDNILIYGDKSKYHSFYYSYDPNTWKLTIDPDNDFQNAEKVTITLKSGITDLLGNRLDGDKNGTPGPDYTYEFNTTTGPQITYPTASAISLNTGASYNITWNGFTGSNVKIELYKGTTLNATISSSTANDGSFPWPVPTSQTAGTDYKIRITSISNTAEVDNSDNNFTINNIPVYYPPRSLTATAGDGQVSLSWTGPSSGNPSSYNVYKGTSENSCSYYANVNSTTFAKTVTGLSNGTRYWFYVRAVYASDISDPSNTKSAVPNIPTSYDEPCNADLLTVQSSCSYFTRTIIGATKSNQVPDASCDYPSNVDVWFKFTIPSGIFSIHTNSLSISSNDCGLAIYTESCSSLIERKCIPNGSPSQSYMPWDDNIDLSAYAGQTGYIRVWEFGAVSQTGEFQICVTGENSNPDCSTFALSETSQEFTYEGGNGSFTIYTGDGCDWSIELGAYQYEIANITSSTVGSGTSTVTYHLDPNPGNESRSTLYTVRGVQTAQSYVIFQDANPSCNPPSAPSSFTASIGASIEEPANGLEHYTNFICSLVPGAEGYSYEYSDNGTIWNEKWYEESFNDGWGNFHDSPNRPVYYRVRSYKYTPKQYSSSYTYASPQPIYTACDDPAAPTINGATTNSLDVTLNTETPVANPSYTTYSILCVTTGQYVQTNGTLGSNEAFQSKSSWGTTTVTGLLSNKEYCFYAKARNNDGDKRYNAANKACGTTVLFAAPVATAATNIANTSFSANWNASATANGYRLDVALDNAFTNYLAGYQNKDVGNVTTSPVTGLEAGATYYYRVKAYTSEESSDDSNVITVATLQVSAPAAPMALAFTNNGQSSFSANWNPSASATGYRLDIALDNAFINYLTGYQNKDVADVTTLTVTGLTSTTTYYYRVRAYNLGGISDFSKTIIVLLEVLPKSVDIIAGGLFSALTTEEKSTITNLTITGIIDARDFKTMRDEMPMLSVLDLSGATIVEYCTGSYKYYDCYPANSIPGEPNWSSDYSLSGKTSLTAIKLPLSATSIGKYSFGGCSGLESIDIQSSVTTIGEYAFSGCSGLTSVIIPSSVTSIETSAFKGCIGLTSIEMPSSITSIKASVFADCIGLTSISIPSSVITIENGAFSGCSKLASINIPSSVNYIWSGVFSGCTRLTSFAIPSSVINLGPSLLNGCSNLTSLYTYRFTPISLNPSWAVFAGLDKTTCILNVPFGSSGLYAAANQWKDFTNIVEMLGIKLSETIVNIASTEGSSAAIELTSNTTWTASSDQPWLTVNPISGTGNNTLTLSAEAIPDGTGRTATVTVSANSGTSQTIFVVQGVSSRTINVTEGGLLSTLTAAELGTITKLTFTGNIDARDFKTMRDNMPFLAELDLSGATIVAYTGTEGTFGKYNMKYPSDIIPSFAFCEKDTWKGKTSLTSVILPTSATSFGESAFMSCSGLTLITIPLSVTSIGYRVFQGCIGLAGIFTIPSSVTSIGEYAFQGCNKLTSIRIPSSVISIGYRAFNWCTGLTSIYTQSIIPVDLSSSPEVFQDVDKAACKLYVPYGSSGLYAVAIQWKDFKNIIENSSPIADAGIDQSINEEATVTLNGSASSDPDGSPLTYKWTAPAGIILNSTTIAKPTFTAPEVIANANYTLSLVVSDGIADSPADQIVITVNNIIQARHFTLAWTGNGIDHMNINIYSAKLDGVELETGDEIGIFDGNICVGAGILTGIVSQTNTLDIAVSRNDGSWDGYTPGNTITFKLYDADKNLEVNNVSAQYSDEDPSWITDGKYKIGTTAFAALTGATKINQDIVLNTGWNIISTRVRPTNLEMKDIFQPLIDAGKLKKVMDEAGKTIENFGAFGGWKNNIGNLNSTKGYKVNVTETSSLSIEGVPVQLPLDINLNTGWNIISYPAASLQDAKALVQSLIDAGKLKKVMDEAGKTIENFGAFGGWKNNIGNFTPGKGYKVNVTENCILTVPASGTKSAVVVPELLASEHFKPVFSGNGTDHMNIHLVDLLNGKLKAGDEIGIFDGKRCVGSAQIGPDQMLSDCIGIPASCNDELDEPNGFTPGNALTMRLFRNNQEYLLNPELIFNSKCIFVKGESLFARVNAEIETGLNELTESVSVKCYPNPFSDQITIEIEMLKAQKLNVKIYDASGRLIRYLYQGKTIKGITLIWDGKNDQSVKMASGSYFLKANDTVKKIVLKH